MPMLTDRKPILLTVDDDPGVSRAIARDLRRRYGDAYRIVRTESGPQALETLREFKLRGDAVAVMLADHRMPDMSGVEFLETAMDLFPRARRVLLTAYADTEAAIQAINVVDLDHYLLKPWDPPEEKLFPVLDALIDVWLASDDRPVNSTQVVGHRWSAHSFQIRDFLARNSVPYRWLSSEEPEGQRLLVAAGIDPTHIPLVVTPSGESLVAPTIGEVAALVGMSTTPATDFYDVVIVGGGPAGLGAAVYAASEGLRTVLVAAGADSTQIPLVVTPSGDSLVAPTIGEVAALVGMSTTPATDFYDVVIVGGGPAGLGAAVYAASEGLRTVLVERHATGGQAGQSARIENYLGFPDGVSGAQLTDRARRQAQRFGAEILAARDVVGLDVRPSSRAVRFDDGHEVVAHAVLLATGISYRKLDVPGADRFTGCGVYYGSAATEAPACAGDEVFIIGGANSAGQAAVFLSRHARRVTMLVRASSLEASMSHYLIRQIAEIANIEVRLDTDVVGVDGDGHLEEITLCDRTAGVPETVKAGYLFVFIGAAPRTEWLGDVVARDPRGFLFTGPDLVVEGRRPKGWPLDRDPYYLEASVPGVFAAGDVRADSVKRVASAVGEGAMAIQLIHGYLERQ